MALTDYQREMEIQTKANCKLAILNIYKQIELEVSAHNERIASLHDRLEECYKTVVRITRELLDDDIWP